MMIRARQTAGFTLVELLIVIVVIAILAAITVVAYNGVQAQALNSARKSEVSNWQQLLVMYKTVNGTFPNMANGSYCLGEGFPDKSGDSIGDCGDLYYEPHRYSESSTLNAALKTIGQLPNATRKPVKNNVIGPYIVYTNNQIGIYQFFEGGSGDCPSNMQQDWADSSGRLRCRILIDK